MLSLNTAFTPKSMTDLRDLVTEHPDFPKPGILFRDISPILADPTAFRELTERLANKVRSSGANKVFGLEARGFILGAAIALELGIPFVPVRKVGKLPGETVRESYKLEYGEATFEIQTDKVSKEDKVAIVDDLLATGGTAEAAAKLVHACGGSVSGYFFAIELSELGGRDKLSKGEIFSLMSY